ncbi:hypothetical protein IT397_00445, partial [Candidatus Nomurabacteria bacterium]|nr:hypothetical protein [Candidatus Nomurabacteria bacterium]
MASRDFAKLKKGLDLCVFKKDSDPRSASIAYSDSGKEYLAGSVEPDTKILMVPSEQVALILSVVNMDYDVNKIETVVLNNKDSSISPVVLKIIADHSLRTGRKISCEVFDIEGKSIFSTDDVRKSISFYNPKENILAKVNSKIVPSTNKSILSGDINKELKKCAIEGFDRNFLTRDNASGYASAVLTKNGAIYSAGQYSGPDKLGTHSEVNAIISAIMDENSEITHLGVVSSKYPDTPVPMCGSCRQFLAEMSSKYNLNVKIITFARDNDKFEETE